MSFYNILFLFYFNYFNIEWKNKNFLLYSLKYKYYNISKSLILKGIDINYISKKKNLFFIFV